MNDEQINKRKQIIYRANHRGIKEMDIILGSYANQHVMDMVDDDLDSFEKIMSENDRDLLTWFTGETPVPAHISSTMFQSILDHTITNS